MMATTTSDHIQNQPQISVDQVIVNIVNNVSNATNYNFQDYDFVPFRNERIQENTKCEHKQNNNQFLDKENTLLQQIFSIDQEDRRSTIEWNVEAISFSSLLEDFIKMKQNLQQSALKNFSHQAQQQEDYIYDPETALYYCPSLDMYYDSETGVYFDKKTNNFYVWNGAIANWQNVTYQFAAIYSQIESTSKQNGTEHLLLIQLDESGEETSDFFIIGKNSQLTKLRTMRKVKHTPSVVTSVSDDYHTQNDFLFYTPFQSNQKHMITRIGRSPKNDIVLDHLLVSNYHAEIIYENVYHQNFFSIRDLGTVNGTFVNEMRLSPAREDSVPVFIRDGDVIRIVHFRFKVKYYEHPSLTDQSETTPSLPATVPKNNQRPAYKLRVDATSKISTKELIAELQQEKANLKALKVSKKVPLFNEEQKENIASNRIFSFENLSHVE
jgi:pSer/pThr/pTyr-binding forkhead associated (FHA) protein